MKNENKVLLFISTREFWKTQGGHQYAILNYLKGLHLKFGYEIHVFTFTDKTVKSNKQVPEIIADVTYAKPISFVTIALNALKYGFRFKHPWPIQNILYYSNANSKAIQSLIRSLNPDAIYVDMIRLAPYIKAFRDLDCIKILGYEDLLSERYRRQLKSNFKNSNISGNYHGEIPAKLMKLQKNKHIRKIILSMESKRIQDAELYYANLYDKGIFISKIEADKLNQLIGKKKAITVMMGIDYKYYSEAIDLSSIPNSISFVGNMNAAANYDTICFIVEKILVHIKSDFQFYIYGDCPKELSQKYGNENIKFMGITDDLRPAIRKTSVFLAPIAFGSGIKTKILESFAMGMPVVTNSVGIEGIEAKNGKDCLISDDPQQIAQFVDILLNNETLRKKLSNNAKQLVYEKYQWEKNWESFKEAGL